MNFSRQPFQPDIDTAFFYGGGSRREVVDDIKTALVNEVPLVTLSGTEGSGKTMICRMVEKELRDDLMVLFLGSGVESFDEVVDGIAAAAALEADGTDRNSRLEQAVGAIREQNRRLAVILDSAEKIFPATLERIRRMLDQVNSEQILIQLLLSGQPLFSINFKQLGIIAFNQVEEKHFSLDTLNSKDTYQYLNHCLEIAGGGDQDLFSAARADRIMDIARGNFRLINQLADKYLRSVSVVESKDVKTDATDLEDMELDDSGLRRESSIGLGNVDLDFLKIPKIGFRWYAIGGVIIALILLLVLLTGGDGEQPEPLPESAKVPDLTLDNVEPDRVEIPRPTIETEPLEVPPPKEAAREMEPETAPSEPLEVVVKQADQVRRPEPAPPPAERLSRETPVVQASPPQVEAPLEKPDVTVKPKQEVVTVVKTEPTAVAKAVGKTEPKPAGELRKTEQTQRPSPASEEVVAPEQVTADWKPEIAIIAEQLRSEAAGQGGAAREQTQQPVTTAKVETETAAVTFTQPEPVAATDKPVAVEQQVEAAKPEQIETVSDPVAIAAESEEAAPPGPSAQPEEIERPGSAELAPPERPDKIEKIVAAKPGPPDQSKEAEKPVLTELGRPVQPEAAQQPVAALSGLPDQSQDAEKSVTVEPDPTDKPEEAEKPVAAEPEPIPQLSVAVKKKQLTEPPPATVVTLKDESKQSPESTAAIPVAAAVPEPVVEKIERPAVQPKPPPPVVEKQSEITTVETKPEPVAVVPEVAVQRSSIPSPQQKPVQPGRDPARYYAERLAAGSRWLVGGSSSKYTVQLMVLNSDEAEQNVRQMLSDQSYQPLRDKLFILKRRGQPQTVMLYFGEFDSQVEAHQAKSNLPSFLTRLDPYAISVKEAVAKARSGE